MPEAPNHRPQRPLFLALILLAGYLTYLVLSPFLSALAWAAVFAILFYQWHRELAARAGPNTAAGLITLSTGLLIVGPAGLLVSVIAGEVPRVADYMQQASLTLPSQIERLWELARARSPVALPETPGLLLQEGTQRAFAFLAPRAGALLTDFFATIGSLISMLFALFFFLRDGDRIGAHIRAVLPLSEEQSDKLIHDTRDLVVASVGAGAVVALAQGAIAAVIFWLLGIAAPVFWGVAAAFCSLIPVVGASLVWVPAMLWLLLSGQIAKGIILLVVGVFGISLVDNVLRPLVLSGRTSISALVIFFGLLGGVAVFGFIGLVVGPIILVTTGSLLRMLTRPDLVTRDTS